MRKLIIAVAFLVGSCENKSDTVTIPVVDYNKLKGDSIKPEYPKGLIGLRYGNSGLTNEIIIHDSCEYIYGQTSYYDGGPVFTHRGQCKFCQKRLEDLIHRLIKPG